MNNLELTASDWAAHDPDPKTRAEVEALVKAKDQAQLADRFGMSLEFGTAGLRGVIGGGPNRMNRAVVRRTTLGLARYLKQVIPNAQSRGVVVGRDGRVMSPEFARDAAEVLAAEGFVVHVFENLAPTPLTAFALQHLKACCAVMVTASHNPPEYNGYKVYWENGAQIVPPHDHGIARSIEACGPADKVKLLPESEARAAGLWKDVGRDVEDAYIDAILALRAVKADASQLKVVYTAMHGVGGEWVKRAFAKAGFTQLSMVAEQFEPDGAFPTVKFPNPEEKGAMDLSTALAESGKADLVLANDPDADRLAVMARNKDGKLRMLTGNEVGVIVGHFLLEKARPSSGTPLVITTIVSSAQLKTIAQMKNAAFDETLTGFKWIANRALELEPRGQKFIFGYEEALGYTVGTVCRDKDGVGTALVVADLAAWLKAQGKTLLDYLEDVQRECGLFVATQANFTFPGAQGQALMKGLMEAFRARPPAKIGAHAVESALDYQQQTRLKNGVSSRLSLPPSNVLAWELAGGSRVTARPSGTEPKIKFYFELKHTAKPGQPMGEAHAEAMAGLNAMEEAFLALAKERGLP